MLKPLPLLCSILCCALFSHAQKTDTLVLFYKSDQFTLSKSDRHKLDSFLLRDWDRVFINGYTDETDEEDYNMDLSKKRSGEVYNYVIAKKFASNSLSSQYYGESRPKGDNNTEEGKALNRRTEIIGQQFARIAYRKPRPAVDPLQPVTKTLDNGFIITYKPGDMPGDMAENFAEGSAMNFQLINNTVQMQENGMYNNTTRGEILSSVLIICGKNLNPCKLSSPILVRVPIPYKTKCPLEKVKFFNTVAENGRRIWQEQSKDLYPETIHGVQYIRLLLDDFCECINFDFKIPECYDIDSTQVQYVNAKVKYLSTELKELNSVYLPRKVDDSTYSVIFVKDELKNATITFSLYKEKRRIRGFKDKLLTSLPYDEGTKSYILTTDSLQLNFTKLKMGDVMVKVNGDRYRVMPEKNNYKFTYLSYKDQKILVDFAIIDSKHNLIRFKDQPLESLPYDQATKQWIIDKKFIKEMKQAESIARR